MENKKFELKWRSALFQKVFVLSTTNIDQFAAALHSIVEDDDSTLVDVTTYEH